MQNAKVSQPDEQLFDDSSRIESLAYTDLSGIRKSFDSLEVNHDHLVTDGSLIQWKTHVELK